jgi:hypothetical protein
LLFFLNIGAVVGDNKQKQITGRVLIDNKDEYSIGCLDIPSIMNSPSKLLPATYSTVLLTFMFFLFGITTSM